MRPHFIENIKFKNFKCFKELDIKNLKRINLISGKNNIGKTSFMEGLELFLSSKDSYEVILNIYKMVKRRQSNRQSARVLEFDIMHDNASIMEINSTMDKLVIEYFDKVVKKVDQQSRMVEYMDVNSFSKQNLFGSDELITAQEPGLKIFYSGEERIFPLERVMTERIGMVRRTQEDKKKPVNYVASSTTDEKEIAIYYGKLVDLNKEKYLDESLSLFDDNISALKQKVTDRDVVLELGLKNRDTPILLSSLGDGINRYIAILCAIWASKDGYLFIDEIENGIHYTNYKKLWKIIFEASKMANCQIFATSHSKECIEVFNDLNKDDEGIYLEFYKNEKNGLISVKERDSEQLNYALTHNREVRGE